MKRNYKTITIFLLVVLSLNILGCKENLQKSKPFTTIVPINEEETIEPYSPESLKSETNNYFYGIDIPTADNLTYSIFWGGYNKYVLSFNLSGTSDEILNELKSIISIENETLTQACEDFDRNNQTCFSCTYIEKNAPANMLIMPLTENSYELELTILSEDDFGQFEPFFNKYFNSSLLGEESIVSTLLSNIVSEYGVSVPLNEETIIVSATIALRDDYQTYLAYYNSRDFFDYLPEPPEGKEPLQTHDVEDRFFVHYQYDAQTECNLVLFNDLYLIDIWQKIDPTISLEIEEPPKDQANSLKQDTLIAHGFMDNRGKDGGCHFGLLDNDGNKYHIGIYKKAWGADQDFIHMNYNDEIHYNIQMPSGIKDIMCFYPDTTLTMTVFKNGNYRGIDIDSETLQTEILSHTGQDIDSFIAEQNLFVSDFIQTNFECDIETLFNLEIR